MEKLCFHVQKMMFQDIGSILMNVFLLLHVRFCNVMYVEVFDSTLLVIKRLSLT